MFVKKYLAEFIGTFTLTLVVGLSISGNFPVSTPVLASLTLVLFVYSIGHISGAHINPAVTLGILSIKKISKKEALNYIVAQFLGAVLALLLVSSLVTMPELTVSNNWNVIIAEIMGMIFFTFGIASVVYGKNSGSLSGVIVGGSLFIGIGIAVLIGSNGVLNPAVAIGIKSFSLAYLFAPIVGSVIGMQIYKNLTLK